MERALALVPIGRGYLDVGAAATVRRGPEAWAEVGWRPHERTTLYAKAFATPLDAGAMVGARWTF